MYAEHVRCVDKVPLAYLCFLKGWPIHVADQKHKLPYWVNESNWFTNLISKHSSKLAESQLRDYKSHTIRKAIYEKSVVMPSIHTHTYTHCIRQTGLAYPG